MAIFCDCAHSNEKQYEIELKISRLERQVEELDWYRKAIVSGSLTRTERGGKVYQFKELKE